MFRLNILYKLEKAQQHAMETNNNLSESEFYIFVYRAIYQLDI